jgi:hypothetical protein
MVWDLRGYKWDHCGVLGLNGMSMRSFQRQRFHFFNENGTQAFLSSNYRSSVRYGLLIDNRFIGKSPCCMIGSSLWLTWDMK